MTRNFWLIDQTLARQILSICIREAEVIRLAQVRCLPQLNTRGHHGGTVPERLNFRLKNSGLQGNTTCFAGTEEFDPLARWLHRRKPDPATMTIDRCRKS